ncbi:DNA-binding response regulator [Paramagnetospirillum kuznetsovii]|uniref:DNA-binding response regulator n=1 Tax=Paramagnetospirillum kuznetsovii TaxID=2053833 RepID=A0A364NUU3_9PROT|nr:response regulator FixJ [Paramagnetospirillum kuznetsovii]RAU20851.1 DNA-binding response regulator [Paramagnetospirillum kuznetsovii]
MAEVMVHLIDDDQGVRDSLAMLLDSAGLAVRSFSSAESFLAGADLSDPGCVVADVRMPGMSGLDLLRVLRDRAPELPVIIITGHADVAMAVQALKGGAADFIEKPFDDSLFLANVRDALNRGQRAFRDRQRRDDIDMRVGELTPREREVMALIVRGLSNKAAAAELNISVRTVEIHRARVMDKMGAESLSALVRMALLLEESA